MFFPDTNYSYIPHWQLLITNKTYNVVEVYDISVLNWIDNYLKR